MHLMRRSQSMWDPFREMEGLTSRMNDLLGLKRWGSSQRELMAAADWAPSCDVSETEKEYRVRAELPDVKKEDVQVTLDDGMLTLQGERREEKQEKNEKFHRRELSYGTFLRCFTMPDDADEGQVDATFKNGLLEIVIPKSKFKPAKAKAIEIR
jgi:HSP20 family protein